MIDFFKKIQNTLNTSLILIRIYRRITENIFLIQTILDLITNIL